MWTFYDYVDGDGANVFHDWLWSLSKKARAKINTRISDLERLPRADWGDYTGPLVGPGWEGIFEMRFFVDRVRLRPLFCYGPTPESATILLGAVEVGGEIEPRNAARTCQARKVEIGSKAHVTRHDFN